LRKDRCYIGTADIKFKTTEKKIYAEVGILLLISAGAIIFLLTHAEILKRYFETGRLNSLLGVFIILVLSPFGAHLIARIITAFWERLK